MTWDSKATFNVPAITDGRVVAGSTNAYLGSKTNGMVPNIFGTLQTTGSLGQDQRSSTSNGTGALTSLETSNAFNYGSGGRQSQTNGIKFDASLVSNLYVTSATQVRAASIYVKMLIRY